MESGLRAKLRRNRIIAILAGIAVLFICIMMAAHILSVRRQNEELAANINRLESRLEEQLQRQAELDDEEAYVKTAEYIEERAKSIGYVYPDEIIFKEED